MCYYLDMELFKDIIGFENYQISSYGRVLNKMNGKFRVITPNNHGRATVKLTKGCKIRKTFEISRLVGEYFIPNPMLLRCVCHKDDNPLNNHIDNLFWGSHQDNIDDMMRKGRNNGRKRPIRSIENNTRYESVTAAAKAHNIDMRSIRCAIKRKGKSAGLTWSYI